MFEYRVNWYNEIDRTEEYARGLVYGKSYVKAMKKVLQDYDETCIIDIYLQPLEDENTIELRTIKEHFKL